MAFKTKPQIALEQFGACGAKGVSRGVMLAYGPIWMSVVLVDAEISALIEAAISAERQA